MRNKGVSVLLILILVVVSFAGGWFFCRYQTTGTLTKSAFSREEIRLLNEARGIIEAYGIEEHSSEEEITVALKALAASLNDPYAYYYTPAELEEYNKSSTGSVEGGIGAVIYDNGGEFMIGDVYVGLTAEAAGLKKGDRILKVNDEDVAGLTVEEVVSRVKGEPDTTVLMTVDRAGEEKNLLITRGNGQREMTEYHMIGSVLYTRIVSFHGSAVDCFKKALAFGEEHGYTALIVDVRENGGGEVIQFAQIADLLLGKGETFYALNKEGKKIETHSSDEKNKVSVPMAVLINGNSASASEALAGALRDLGNARLVGTKSFGKGIMQLNVPLTNGGMFKLTTAKYYLPSGECIQDVGLTPEGDAFIEQDPEITAKPWTLTDDNDVQLQKALEILTK